MKRICYGCKAFSLWTYGHHCWLDKKQGIRRGDVVPLEDCPKPKTYADYDRAMKERDKERSQL